MKILTFGEFKKSYHVNFKAKEEDEEFIGRGGYGAVFKGYYIKGNQEVAIKRSDTDKKLLDEVVMAAKVPIHPNIARYLDGFRVDSEADDFDVAILQYYPKGNLGDLFFNEDKKVKLTEKQIDGLLKGVLEGLQFLHEGFKDSNNEHIRIIHRDLKPQNILIAEYKGNYTPLITDFGVSKLVNEQDFLSTGKFELTSDAGTLVYKAPEQIKGEIAKSNLDLWAFGVMVFKILTKKLPFFTDASPSTDAFKMEIMSKITNSDLEEVFVQVNDQPQKYQHLIKRCLVRDIKDRVQTAQELIDILDEIPDKLALANALLEKNEYEKAKEKFEEILELKPNYSPAKKGLKDCEDSIKEEANIIDKLELANSFLEEKKYKEAQENFEIVLKQRPNQENALQGLEKCKNFFREEKIVTEKIATGNKLLNEGKYEDAKTYFETVLSLRPHQEIALKGLQICKNGISKVKEILSNLSSAKNLLLEHKYQEAKSQFESVLMLDSDNIEAKSGLNEAEKNIEESNKINGILESAQNLWKEKKYIAAKKLYEEILTLQPQNTFAIEGIENCNSEIKKEELPTDIVVKPVRVIVEELPTDVADTPNKPNFIIVPVIENFTVTPQKVKPGDSVSIAWEVTGNADKVNIKSSNLSFYRKVTSQGQMSVVVQNETVFTIEVFYGDNKKAKTEKVEIITSDSNVNPQTKPLWESIKIPVGVVGTLLVLYLGYLFVNDKNLKAKQEVASYTQELVEKAKREREAKAVKGDSLFIVGNEQLGNGTDKTMVSNTFREAIAFKPGLRSEVYKLFVKKADKLKETAPAVSEKYRKLADEFK